MPRGQKKTRAVFFCAAGCCGNGDAGVWTRRPKFSVIQRPQAVESPRQAHTPNRGRGRVALSTVILAQRGSPTE